MLAHTDKARESHSVANPLSQRRSSGESAFPSVDDRPQALAQRRRQERANSSPHVKQLQAYQEMANDRDGAGSGKPVQRVKRDARVTWAVTHLVRVQGSPEDETLFGKGNDWQSGEVPPELGQLSRGQAIVVDDEEMFMSRRGANQEDPARREQDRNAGGLKHKWLKVLAVDRDGGLQQAPEHAYVRAETIQLIGGVEKPSKKKIDVIPHGPEENEAVSKDLEGFHEAWQQAAAKRRRSIGQVNMDFEGRTITDNDDDEAAEITSGWNWDKYDEGKDVSGYMKDPEERKPLEEDAEQHTLSANYVTEQGREPIAYMVLEVRDYGAGPFMYIRWLIAHPNKGGGGSALVEEAKDRLNKQGKYTELRVESAYSAVSWYESLGFEKVIPDKKVVEEGVGYADTELVYRKQT
jgi:hypothetical protein